ncbi:MAG: PEP-CTERM sorting domain-containing protein [Phycisphaeraceae bacterium]|nr:hypothetical protein [Phycisphaerales bacterium]MCB9859694.1 PEP-CTERM sorting domain-containing protein [Phycisphaeraceae bacterium]
MKRSLCAVVALACTSAVRAQLNVAIAAAATPTSCQFTDVQQMLAGSGLFSSVSYVEVMTQTPSLAELQQYDAVITWSNLSYQSGEALGNVLADYVDAGGGVVVATFANSSVTAERSLTGRWSTGYDVILPRSGNQGGNASLGQILDPSHPIMDSVTTFTGGTSMSRPSMTLLEVGATEIAQWNDGRTLVAVGANPKRVDLGFYPPSSNCTSAWWSSGTDGGRMLAQALAFVATDTGCYADCDGSGALNIFDYICFGNEYSVGTSYADCDGSGALNIFDYICFGNEYSAGCP